MTDRMGALDAYFLFAEADGTNHMHVGGVALATGTAPSAAEVVDMLRGKLSRIPRYRQVVRLVPLNLGRPVWEDAPDFRVTDHVSSVILPSPGDDSLSACIGEFISERLDRSRPLWELLIIDGLDDDSFAIAWKIHHCMVDGVSGTELLTVLFDDGPRPSAGELDTWEPQPPSSTPGLVARAALDLIGGATDTARQVTRAQLKAVRGTTFAALSMGARMITADPRLPLNGRIGPERSFRYTAVPFSDIKEVRAAFGGTINDVVLAAVLHGFSTYLEHRGVRIQGRALRVMVPVALRGRDAQGRPLGDGTMETKASGLLAVLPLDIADPGERVRVVSQILDGLKLSANAAAVNAVNELSGLLPSTVSSVATRVMSALPQRAINTVVTNVPGPPVPLYVLGRPIDRIFNYAPPFPVGARSSVTVYSYNGLLQFGVTTDRNSMPDLHVLVDGIKDGADGLLSAAR